MREKEEVEQVLKLLDNWEKKRIVNSLWDSISVKMEKERPGRHRRLISPGWFIPVILFLAIINVCIAFMVETGRIQVSTNGSDKSNEKFELVSVMKYQYFISEEYYSLTQ